MNNFDKVLSMVRNEDEAISAWNKIPASKKGYNPSVNKIISLICEQITSETIRKYDEKYLTPCEFNKKYSNPRLVEHYVIPYEKGSHLPITTDAEKIIDRLKKVAVKKDPRFTDSYFYYKISHNNECCVISMICPNDIHNAFDIIQKCLNDSGWVATTGRNTYDCGQIVTEIVIEPITLTPALNKLINIKEFYHITKNDRIEYIRKNGIIPSRSNNEKISFCYLEDRAFFTIKNDEQEIDSVCKGFVSRELNRQTLSESKNDYIIQNSPYYLITIDATKINIAHCYCDKHNDNHFFTTDTIKPDSFINIENIKSCVHKSNAIFNKITQEYDFYPEDEHFYIESKTTL